MRYSVHLSCTSNKCNITKQIVKHIVKHIETYQHQEIIKTVPVILQQYNKQSFTIGTFPN